MNLRVNLGKDINDKEVTVDLKKDNIHFIILVGTTGSGKSVFHYHIYKQLAEQNKPEELGFVFFDMTRVDFAGWQSPHVVSYIRESDQALNEFEELGKTEHKKAILIHIEEMNMLLPSAERFEAALKDVLKHKNMYVVFSTSRPSVDVLTPTIKSLVDLKVVFVLASEFDSKVVLGESLAENFTKPGERVLVYNGKKVFCEPLNKEQIEADEKFFWP